jgi:hypothetical protein
MVTPHSADHATVLAAIDKARITAWTPVPQGRNAHCDDLRATAERHAPEKDDYGVESCRICLDGEGAQPWEAAVNVGSWWPCADARQVIERLTGWGVL